MIEIDHVTKRFDDYVAVADADFTIGSGEFFSMLGPSGCGKTTTLRMIAGFETPTEGAIRLEGTDVSRVPPHKRNVNTVFQHYALFPHMTVIDNVTLAPLLTKKMDKATAEKRALELLDQVGLAEKANVKPATLSGGQKQRVAIARALAMNPDIMLFDEATSALDGETESAVMEALSSVEKDVTILMVAHRLTTLRNCTQVVELAGGAIQRVGSYSEIIGLSAR